MWKLTWSVHYHVLSHEYSFFSFILPSFPLGKMTGGAVLGGLDIPHESWLMTNRNLKWFCWLHTKTEPSKVSDVVTPPSLWRPLGRFTVSVASRTCLANLFQGSLDIWPNQRSWRSWDLSIRRSGWTFGPLRMSQLRNLSRSVAPWTPERAALTPLPFKRGQREAEVPFDNSITGNFTVYQDRL